MEAELLCWVMAGVPAHFGELVAWDYSADAQTGALMEMVVLVVLVPVAAGREQGVQIVLLVSNCRSFPLSNSYASPQPPGSFVERAMTPSFFAEFVALAGLVGLVQLLVAALAPGAFSI